MPTTFATSAARIPLQVGLVVAVVLAAQFNDPAFGQDADGPIALTTEPLGMTGWRRDPVTIETEALGMTGWWPDPAVTITTSTLGMAGWLLEPVALTTGALGMTGWRPEPVAIETETLAMTGWQHDPITVTAPAAGMTGWAGPPQQCSVPFVLDDTGADCVCPPGLLPSGNSCIAATTSPPFDLSVEQLGADRCEAGKPCPFDILVTNIGAGPFQGPLVVNDAVNLTGAQISSATSGWTCAAGACVRPGLTLAPGASEMLTVNVRVPADTPTGSRLRQCAELTAPQPGDTPVRFVQLMLPVAGIDAGPADNQLGGRTRRAIETFRTSVGLSAGTDIDEALVSALRDLVPRDPQPENDRACAAARVVR